MGAGGTGSPPERVNAWDRLRVVGPISAVRVDAVIRVSSLGDRCEWRGRLLRFP